MALTIKDLVKVNQNAVLDSGVQLGWYKDPDRNDYYATGFLFSHGEFTGNKFSAIRIFEMICESFLNSSKPNVLTVIAGYGQGKTHFALVLANFFGRPAKHPLVEQIIDQIRDYSDNQTAEHFRYFKRNAEKPQLVVKLSGDTFVDLRQGFLQALRLALDEHEATKEYAIKSTSLEAARWLRSLSDAQQEQAEMFLEKQNEVELDDLIEKLENFDVNSENLAKEISKELNNVYADFGADINFTRLIEETVDELCIGTDVPFNKMLILFDELGLYLEKWLSSPIRAGNEALQQIINACRNRPGKVSLVTFIQRDPDQYANYAQPDEVGVTRFTTRLQERVILAANLELVFEHLIQRVEQNRWETFMRTNINRFESAARNALVALPQYYQEEWSEGKFTEVVAQGAFPLHPLTAALLCRLDFAQGRSVMKFVDDAIKEINDEPAVLSTGQPNWILPIHIVYAFAENFSRQEGLAVGKSTFSDYSHAVSQLGENVDEELYAVLKALFLYNVGKVKKLSLQSHASALAPLAGMTTAKAEGTLKRLADDFLVIRYIGARSEYEFSGVGTNANVVLEQLRREIAGQGVSSLAKARDALNLLKQLDDEGELPDTTADRFKEQYVVEGREWKLEWRLVDASVITPENLKPYVNELSSTDTTRGVILCVLPKDSAERSRLDQKARRVLDASQRDGYPYPIVIALTHSAEALQEWVLMRRVLEGWSTSKKQHYGKGFDDALNHIQDKLRERFGSLIRDVVYIVAESVRAKLPDYPRPNQIASHLFHCAYPYRPSADSHVMQPHKTTGQKYTAEVGRYLITNDLSADGYEKLSKELRNFISAVLMEGKDKWGILDRNCRISPTPQNSRVQKAWEVLSDTIPTDERPVLCATLVDRFKSVPYGYDDIALTLLLTAWIGFHHYELSFRGDLNPPTSRRKQPQPYSLRLKEIASQLTTAKKFVQWLINGQVSISRTNVGQWCAAAVVCAEQMRDVREYEKALQLLEEGETYADKLPADDEQLQELQTAKAVLIDKVKAVKQYKLNLAGYGEKLEQTSDLSNVLSIERELSEQTPPQGMGFDNSALNEVKQKCQQRTDELITQQVEKKLTKLEEYEKFQADLGQMSNLLSEYGLPDRQQRVLEALSQLNSDYEVLKAEEAERVERKTERARASTVNNHLDNFRRGIETMKRRSDFVKIFSAYQELLNWTLPDELELKLDEQEQIETLKTDAMKLLAASLDDLLTAGLPTERRGFERRQETLDEAYQLVGNEPSLPEAWQADIQNAQKTLNQAFDRWQQEQAVQQRQEAERRRVQSVVSQAKRANRWIEVEEALAAIGTVHMKFETLSDELEQQLADARECLESQCANLQEWLTNLPQKLSATTTLQELEKRRSEIRRQERDYTGYEDGLRQIDKSCQQLAQREEFLKDLFRLIKQADSVEGCKAVLPKINELSPVPAGLETIVRENRTHVEKELAQLRAKRRAEIDEWLAKLKPAVEGNLGIEDAGQIQRILDKRPPYDLTEDDESVLNKVRSAIDAVFDADLIEKVIREFERISSPELRAECLKRLTEICQS